MSGGTIYGSDSTDSLKNTAVQGCAAYWLCSGIKPSGSEYFLDKTIVNGAVLPDNG
jgi:hypothetical protein